MSDPLSTCSNCNHTLNNKYCGHCGQPAQIKRVDRHYIMHEIQHVLHVEKGILYTVKELLFRPGQNIKEFISTNRSRLVKPIIFIIITSLIYSTIDHFFHLESSYVEFNDEKTSAGTAIFAWIKNHYGYSNIMMGVFIAWWLRIFFKAYDYNFFEILILLCFVMGMGMLILSIFAFFEGLTKVSLMQISGAVSIVYCVWAIAQFFDKRRAVSYIKALIAYTLGMFTFFGSAMLLGYLIDSLLK